VRYYARSLLPGVSILIAGLFLTLSRAPASVAQPAAATAKASAPIDLTGSWVSIVNEDWRWRMLTPPKGDYTGVPLNDAGRKISDAWSEAEDGSCKAYGVGGLLRMPTHLKIDWESDEVLRIKTDSGLQVRSIYFASPPPLQQRTLQGRSVAQWQFAMQTGDGWGFGIPSPPRPGGSLRVVTTDFLGGWLRRNGVPYGENARITEYYDTFSAPDGNQWFVVTTIIDDPEYLYQPYITSSHFRRETGTPQWTPRPCKEISAAQAPGQTSHHLDPGATIQEIMETQIDPAADRIWDAVEFEATLEGTRDRHPQSDADWQAIRHSALTLIEATNLLSVEGRRVANRPGEVAPGEQPPEEIQRQVDATHPQFVGFAGTLRAASLGVLAAIDARDPKALLDAGDVLDKACEACHMTYWYPGAKPPVP